MKKILSLFVLMALAFTVIGCSRSDYNHLLIDPRYSEAQFRAEIGNLFFESDAEIGMTTSFGFFIYDLGEEKLTTAFALDDQKAFGKEYFIEARLSKDEKTIILSGYSHEKNFDEYFYGYDIETGNLYKVEEIKENDELYPLPDQDRSAFETSNWTAEDLAYYPPNSDTPHYPFKNRN